VISQTDDVILLRRATSEQSVLIAYNFSDQMRTVVQPEGLEITRQLMGMPDRAELTIPAELVFEPYGVGIWVIQD